jgi:hypothetical protein
MCVHYKKFTELLLRLFSRLGGVKVSLLAIGSKVHGYKAGRGDGFLKAMKIHSKTSIEGEVKPSAHVVRFYKMLKNPA